MGETEDRRRASSLGEALCEHRDEIVQRWYETWSRSPHPRPEVGEAALKDKLPLQLAVIGEQLKSLHHAEAPGQMWKTSDRLDPELRVGQDIPIEEVVQEYEIAVRVVRDWVEEQGIEPPFDEYSYFFSAVFELVAESVRRYAEYEAQQVKKERAAYLAGVMHQLRSPLSAASTALELLERTDPGDRGAFLGFASRLRRNMHRVEHLVRGVLRLERFSPDDAPVDPEALDLHGVVREVMETHETLASRKGLRFESHVGPLHVTLDRNLLLDALGNLVENAVKYTDRGFVLVEAEEDGSDVVVRVRDSGPGLSPEARRNLFEPTRPGDARGAGIGLRIAQHAARAQGGCIEVQSEADEGSTFTLHVPRSVPSRAGGQEPS